MFLILRIISGIKKGKRIDTTTGCNTRPTMDRVRENVFNIIQNEVQGAVILDLFAGSGAIGLEGLSRRAKFCYFNDLKKVNLKVIKENIMKCNFEDKVKLFSIDWKDCLNKISDAVDIIYLDPPYSLIDYDDVLKKTIESKVCEKKTLIIFESNKDRNITEEYYDFSCYRKAKYGNTILRFYMFMGGDKL